MRSGTLALSLILFGCTGSIDTVPESDTPSITPWGDEDPMVFGVSALRRNNNREFRNAVQDLLGVEFGELYFEDQKSGQGYDNNGTSLFFTDDSVVEYGETVFSIAEIAATEGATPFEGCTTKDCVTAASIDFLSQAFRGPVDPASTARLADLLEDADSLEESIRTVVSFTLLSPNFVFHPQNRELEESRVDPLILADRLAATFWSSHPDTVLASLAADGSLDAEAVRAQSERMLADPKAKRFFDDFSSLWLRVDGLDRRGDTDEEQVVFDAMKEETLLFGREVLKNRPLRDLLTAKTSFVNKPLADHYGIPSDALGTEFVETALPAERQGLFTQGSLLTLHSPDHIADPIRRGVFIADVLLCFAAPGGVPDVPPLIRENEAQTVREILGVHRENPVCASCHDRTDPIGLSLETFDAIGRYREAYDSGSAIETADTLHTGESFADAVELQDVIADRGDLERCLSKHVATYLLGRQLNYADEKEVDRVFDDLVNDKGAENLRFTDIVLGLVTSPVFLNTERMTGEDQ